MLLWHFFGVLFVLQSTGETIEAFPAKPLNDGIFSGAAECPARQCRLAILCWMDGGNSHEGCGYTPWLYSCCMQNSQTTVKKRHPNYINPSKLKRHGDAVQSSFSRRRYDSSENQVQPLCGIPRTPSNTLQKRIIGGRPAHFAEFPWQSHIRIKEFQCGGGEGKVFHDWIRSSKFKRRQPFHLLVERTFSNLFLPFHSTCVKKVCRHRGTLRFSGEAT
jgi:hypothetical protein